MQHSTKGSGKDQGAGRPSDPKSWPRRDLSRVPAQAKNIPKAAGRTPEPKVSADETYAQVVAKNMPMGVTPKRPLSVTIEVKAKAHRTESSTRQSTSGVREMRFGTVDIDQPMPDITSFGPTADINEEVAPATQ